MKKLILLSLCLFGCKKEKQPQIGKLYTHSFSYLDSFENPFEAIKIDTLIVLDVKENYVLYQFNNGYKRSDKITWFNKVTKKNRMKKDLEETILCAAIYFPNIELNHPCQCTNIDKGTVLAGFRHGHIIAQFTALTGSRLPLHKHEQGFITTHNRFLNRKEAHKLFIETGNIPEFKDELYSEDLY